MAGISAVAIALVLLRSAVWVYEDTVGQHADESIAVFFDDPCRGQGDIVFERSCLSYFDRARHPRSGS